MASRYPESSAALFWSISFPVALLNLDDAGGDLFGIVRIFAEVCGEAGIRGLLLGLTALRLRPGLQGHRAAQRRRKDCASASVRLTCLANFLACGARRVTLPHSKFLRSATRLASALQCVRHIRLCV